MKYQLETGRERSRLCMRFLSEDWKRVKFYFVKSSMDEYMI